MAKQAKQKKQSAPPQAQPFPTSENDSADSSEGPSFIRIKVPLKSDGSIDLSQWDARDTTKERYRSLITNPEFLKKIGVSGSAAAGSAADAPSQAGTTEQAAAGSAPTVVTPTLFPPEQIVWMFDVYACIIAFVFSAALKSDFETAYNTVKFDDEQKSMLARPLSIVIAKYTPAEWFVYAPEIELSVALVAITGGKFAQMKQVIAEQREREMKTTVRPIDKPADGARREAAGA